MEDKFYTILYSLHAVLQHAFTLTHPKQNKNINAQVKLTEMWKAHNVENYPLKLEKKTL